MKLLLIALVCIIATVSASDLALRQKFAAFKAKFGKSYSENSVEHQNRFQIFKDNLQRAAFAQKMDKGSAVHGVTKFSDLTPAEFRAKYLMHNKLSAEQMAEKTGLKRMTSSKVGDVPASFDWREKGAVTAVKDQGQCGSCWAFSTTGSLESQRFVKYNKNGSNVALTTLSEQQLVDCDRKEDQGCNGGLMVNAFEYIAGVGGLEAESSYPYTAMDGQCKFDKSKIVEKTAVTGAKLLPKDPESIKANLVAQGALSVAINAEWLQTYVGGISAPWLCAPGSLDHGVLIVGYGKGKDWFGNEVDYWIVKNSWSAGWGESGYFQQAIGKTGNEQKTCGIQTYVVDLSLP